MTDKKKLVTPCRCGAYPFPHRVGGGACKQTAVNLCPSGYPTGLCRSECRCGWDDPPNEPTLSAWERNPSFRSW